MSSGDSETTSVGRVLLVGAGPGDPGLITVKGLRVLSEAHVVVYDRLVDKRLLHHTRGDAELVFVGKARGDGAAAQEEINAVLIGRARQGKTVVRLKGGDPFVFGRGGEEAEALTSAGVPFEIVPGVTSAIAVPAYTGIPVTHRDLASSVTIVSGSEAATKKGPGVRWDVLAHLRGTLVILMGWETLPDITKKLIRHGMVPSTPAALVQCGTKAQQRTVTGTLATIVEAGKDASIEPPVVAIIGEVVTLRDNLRWFDKLPLFGLRVLITRSLAQSGSLSEQVAALGAEPVELPTVKFLPPDDLSPLDDALRHLAEYQWVGFTSVNAVEAFFGRLRGLGQDARVLASVKVCAIGRATAGSLLRHGVIADLVPKDYVSSALVTALRRVGVTGKRFLLPRSDIAGEELAGRLQALGVRVDQIIAYRTVVPQEGREYSRELLAQGVDVVTFTSPSTVRNLLYMLGNDLSVIDGATVASIGPVTARAARQAGLRVDIEAEEHTIPGLVRAMVGHFIARRGG